jgi:NADH:ubiquinone oxidoreductase subunit C
VRFIAELRYSFSQKKFNKTSNLDFFLLTSSSVVSLYSRNSKYYLYSFFTEKVYWSKLFLVKKFAKTHILNYVVDGIQYRSNNNLNIQFNCSSMLIDSRLHLYTTISSLDFKLASISRTFPSTLWLERERAEFTNMVFYNSSDTRRLLLDYFQNKQEISTHSNNEKSYSNLYSDVVFNY